MEQSSDLDVVVVGGGAAGLATAIFSLQQCPTLRIAVLDGARRPGAKILVSGGARCNVTNAVVTEQDFNGGRSSIIRRVLRALPVPDTIAFFRHLGVALHEEAHGKLFPDSNRARDVLSALLRELERVGGELRLDHRVLDLSRDRNTFQVQTSRGEITAPHVVLATGGLSLPKTGSDGAGYRLAQRFGHTLVPTTPALAPLVVDARAHGGNHAALSGVSHDVRLDLRLDKVITTRIGGAMLWTHFGVSGPAILDVSRHLLRGELDQRNAQLTASFLTDESFESLEQRWLSLARQQPRIALSTALGLMLPASLASTMLQRLELDPAITLAGLAREDRRRLVRATLEWPLPVSGSRGYNYAEATAGGVDLREIDPSSMMSRSCDSLYLVGEMLDVDGRIGGFNFQWAWASARVAADALARRRLGS